MPVTRHFLGWDGPFLQRVVDHLAGDPQTSTWDLSKIIAVLPAQRAGGGCLNCWSHTHSSTSGLLIPPRIITVGRLPELLYQPTGRIADTLDVDLAWVHALRNTDPAETQSLIPSPPSPDDLPGWWALANQLRALSDDLAGHRMRFQDVPRLCADRGVDLRGEERWRVLAQVETRYHQVLLDQGLYDKNQQRSQAVIDKRCALDNTQRVVLIGTSDLERHRLVHAQTASEPHHCLGDVPRKARAGALMI